MKDFIQFLEAEQRRLAFMPKPGTNNRVRNSNDVPANPLFYSMNFKQSPDGQTVDGELHTKSGIQIIQRKPSKNTQYPWIVIGRPRFGSTMPGTVMPNKPGEPSRTHTGHESGLDNLGHKRVVCRTDAQGNEAYTMYFSDMHRALDIFNKMS